MSDTLWTQTLSAFRDATASDAPTPGGGSVSMVGASFGLGLVIMALEITTKKPDPGNEGALADLIKEARGLLAEISHHADEDIAVFQAYMAALKMPKATDAEKAARKSVMDDALKNATQAPLNAARSCVNALALAERAAELSSVRVISDVGAGTALLQGAVSAVLLNVDINLPGIKQPELATTFAGERASLEGDAERRRAAVLSRVKARLSAGK
jgi:formiminotetrahydrofolate cyclodeaminase